EEGGGPTDVVVVEVGERHHIEAVAVRGLEVPPKFGGEVDVLAPVLLAGLVYRAHVGIVEQQLLPAPQVNAVTIRIAERVKRDRRHRLTLENVIKRKYNTSPT